MEAVCDKVVILSEGNAVAIGSCNQVKDKFGSGFCLQVTFYNKLYYKKGTSRFDLSAIIILCWYRIVIYFYLLIPFYPWLSGFWVPGHLGYPVMGRSPGLCRSSLTIYNIIYTLYISCISNVHNISGGILSAAQHPLK